MPSPLAGGRSAQLYGSTGQVLLPDHSSFCQTQLPGWTKRLPAHHKSQSVGVFHCTIPSPEETAILSHSTKLHELAAKKTTQETHRSCSLMTWETATPEESCCLEKSISFISSSAEQAEECPVLEGHHEDWLLSVLNSVTESLRKSHW